MAQITGVRVRETVPDSILDRADAIELVDITPDDLIQRLREGKVYVPKQAERALEHFFSPANLTALRELALRRTAERVDEQLLTQMQARAIPGPGPRASGSSFASARIRGRPASCAIPSGWPTACMRLGRRSMSRPGAACNLTEEERDRIADTLRLAQALGGEAVTIPGGDRRIADDVIAFAQANNITQVIIGKSTRSWWFELLHGSVVARSGAPRAAISASMSLPARSSTKSRSRRRPSAPAERSEPSIPALCLSRSLAVAAAVGVSELLWPWIGLPNTDLVFLTAIVGIAVRFGLWPSLLASVASALCYNFFFTEPYHTFNIADPTERRRRPLLHRRGDHRLQCCGARAHSRRRGHGRGRARPKSLYAFSRKLSGVGTLDDVLWATAYQIALMLKLRVVLCCRRTAPIAVKAGYPPEDILDEADIAAAKWAWEHDRPAGRGSDTLPGAKRLFLPMRTGRGAIGVVGIDSDKPGPLLTPDQRRLLDALIDQAALAIERVHLVDDLDRAERRVEADRLRAALLTSISHDLKTPLAAIIGAAGTLKGFSASSSDRGKVDLISTIIEESERLNRFIANLLDMTKLEAGVDQAEHGASRCWRDRRERARAGRQNSGRPQGGGRDCRRSADARTRSGAVRAGAVQPARQCG